MKWIGISGGWRKTNKEIEEDVRNVVREILLRGDGIVSGGALGVDFIALNEALKHDPEASRIKIFLPASLEIYAAHFRKRAEERSITVEQAENLIYQLTRLKKINSRSLIENMENPVVDKKNYYERNSQVVEASDELVAWRIKSEFSEGMGVKDTIDKARQKGIPTRVFNFDLSKNDSLNTKV